MSLFVNGLSSFIKKSSLWMVLFCSVWICGYKLTPQLKQLFFSNLIEKRELLRYTEFHRRFHHLEAKRGGSAWCDTSKPLIWAHAGGGQLGFYMNCKEAIDDSIKRGFNVVELDVNLTSDNVPVLTHGFETNEEIMFDRVPSCSEFLSTPVCGRYTPLTLSQFFDIYAQFLRDGGWVSLDPQQSPEFDLVSYLEENISDVLLSHVIYQINSREDLLRLAENNPFGALHYCLIEEVNCVSRSKPLQMWRFPVLIDTLRAMGIRSCSFMDRPITDDVRDMVHILSKAGIVVSVARCNSLSRYRKWRNVGVLCVNSELLTPEDIGSELIGND